MKVGDKLNVFKAGYGRCTFERDGTIDISIEKKDEEDKVIHKKFKNLGLIAAGSGLTPILQIIRAVDQYKLDINISLLFCNKTEDDILLRKELEQHHKNGVINNLAFTLTQ